MLYVYLAIVYALHIAGGCTHISTSAWYTMNDPQLIDAKVKRLYLFSKDDEMVLWKDVIEHATDAKDKG